MIVAGLLSQIHAFIVITLQADQVVSGLALTMLGAGISLVLGEGLSKAGTVSLMPSFSIPLLSQIPVIGPIFFTDQSVLVYIGYLLTPLAWYYINRTRPGLHLRAVGEYPSAADALGINVFRMRYFYVFVGGMLAGLGGATISLAVAPGWFSELTTGGQGWIAVGLVIFAQWDPIRACGRRLCLWRVAPADPGYPGPAGAVWPGQSVLLQSLPGFLPADAPVCLHDHRAGHRLARSDAQAPGCAGCAGQSIYPRRARQIKACQRCTRNQMSIQALGLGRMDNLIPYLTLAKSILPFNRMEYGQLSYDFHYKLSDNWLALPLY